MHRAGNIAGGSIAIFDINLDERNDIVITSSAFDMVAYLQLADHSFRRTAKEYTTAASIIESAIAVGDLNCDGCPDAVGVQVGHICIFTGRGCALERSLTFAAQRPETCLLSLAQSSD